ncbi:hypothetical protein EV421DRAFT_1787651 [Armillaria borealis]|uniref:Uncharacterized protein n=1 Tax=Armillaria borealis TaxID=47425 RepID=A0AA39JRQ7_9AGAR|nr:hypothetical protein EV421DRAFT_1787651 [Armillaria borealis]
MIPLEMFSVSINMPPLGSDGIAYVVGDIDNPALFIELKQGPTHLPLLSLCKGPTCTPERVSIRLSRRPHPIPLRYSALAPIRAQAHGCFSHQRSIAVHEEPDRPQPRLDRHYQGCARLSSLCWKILFPLEPLRAALSTRNAISGQGGRYVGVVVA